VEVTWVKLYVYQNIYPEGNSISPLLLKR